ncbi:MAG: hypothetical protein MZV64_34565 [Ignavibacteriales bacterium]|nr:hypothetical protein [Ignavibacteriales bacterium]
MADVTDKNEVVRGRAQVSPRQPQVGAEKGQTLHEQPAAHRLHLFLVGGKDVGLAGNDLDPVGLQPGDDRVIARVLLARAVGAETDLQNFGH